MKSIKHKKLFKAQCLNINCKSKEKICKFAYQNRISTTKWQKKGEQQNKLSKIKRHQNKRMKKKTCYGFS